MKRISGLLLLLAAVILCSGAMADVEINEIHFPDANFRNYILENVDENTDGMLSSGELQKTTSMICNSLSISSLQGIEHFEKLETLICSDNALEELDVSRNRKLIKLYCGNNRLTSLNVKNNSKLQLLDCSFNLLTSLDVRQNRKLVRLDCYSNRLTTLKVSSAKMTRMWTHDNALKKLDISQCRQILKTVRNNRPTDYGSYWGYGPERTCSPAFTFDKTVKVILDEGVLEPVLPKPVTGDVFIVDGVKYQVVAEEQVSFAGPDRPGSKTDIVIPETVKYNGYRFSVTEIAEKALNNETKLVRVAIGKNVERIGRNAFRNCAALKTVIIRTSRLTDASVGSNAFKGIYPKASVQVPAAKLKEYRELLSKKGLPKTAKIRTL